MSKEFKKNFFMCLMAVLLVVSNLLGLKLTNFFDITIGVDFVTYPFTFLCTLLILNWGDKKDAYRSILIASVIQLLITISYALATSLGTQSLMPDASIHVNEVFKVSQLNILASVLAFISSHCLLIYIYDNFKYYGRELYGVVVGLLGSLFLHSVIYLVISLSDYEPIYIINMLLSNILINIVMVIIVLILFYIIKSRDVIEEVNSKSEEIVKDKKKVNLNSKNNNHKKSSTSTKGKTYVKKNSTKKANTSKQKVNSSKKK